MKLNTQFCKSLNLTNICLTSYIDILLLRKPLGDRGTLRAGGTADDSASCSEVPAAPAASGLGCTKCPEILKRSKDVSAAEPDLKDFQGYPLVFFYQTDAVRRKTTLFSTCRSIIIFIGIPGPHKKGGVSGQHWSGGRHDSARTAICAHCNLVSSLLNHHRRDSMVTRPGDIHQEICSNMGIEAGNHG